MSNYTLNLLDAITFFSGHCLLYIFFITYLIYQMHLILLCVYNFLSHLDSRYSKKRKNTNYLLSQTEYLFSFIL